MNGFMKKQTTALAVVCVINLALFFVKLYVGLSISSIAVYSDAINNLLDCVTGIIAFAGIMILSNCKEDKRYPFGKGRLQELINLFAASVITVAGVSFAYSSVERIMYPAPVSYITVNLYIILFTAAVKLLLAFYLKQCIKNKATDVIKGMYLDSVLDFFITFCTVLSYTVSAETGINADGLTGAAISIVIICSGIGLMKKSIPELLGRRNETACKEAAEFLAAVKVTVYDVQCHCYGEKRVFTAKADITECDIKSVSEAFRSRFDADVYFLSSKKEEE